MMQKNRLEAFSDGVLAIVITIMVLELKVPHGSDLHALTPLIPVFLSYILSFLYIGIYWNNHHHLLHATRHINGRVLWANLHLLFWLSLLPFSTGWMGENHFNALPTAIYGINLAACAVAYWLLVHTITSAEKENNTLRFAIGRDYKGMLSVACYCLAVPLAFYHEWISQLIYLAMALVWVIPDSRIEKNVPKIPA
jgi:uncharacterized membrane protein